MSYNMPANRFIGSAVSKYNISVPQLKKDNGLEIAEWITRAVFLIGGIFTAGTSWTYLAAEAAVGTGIDIGFSTARGETITPQYLAESIGINSLGGELKALSKIKGVSKLVEGIKTSIVNSRKFSGDALIKIVKKTAKEGKLEGLIIDKAEGILHIPVEPSKGARMLRINIPGIGEKISFKEITKNFEVWKKASTQYAFVPRNNFADKFLEQLVNRIQKQTLRILDAADETERGIRRIRLSLRNLSRFIPATLRETYAIILSRLQRALIAIKKVKSEIIKFQTEIIRQIIIRAKNTSVYQNIIIKIDKLLNRMGKKKLIELISRANVLEQTLIRKYGFIPLDSTVLSSYKLTPRMITKDEFDHEVIRTADITVFYRVAATRSKLRPEGAGFRIKRNVPYELIKPIINGDLPMENYLNNLADSRGGRYPNDKPDAITKQVKLWNLRGLSKLLTLPGLLSYAESKVGITTLKSQWKRLKGLTTYKGVLKEAKGFSAPAVRRAQSVIMDIAHGKYISGNKLQAIGIASLKRTYHRTKVKNNSLKRGLKR